MQRNHRAAAQSHRRTDIMTLSKPGDAATRPGAPFPGTTQPTGLILFALAMGGFAIGTAEFAVMSLLPYFSAGLGIDEPSAGHVISAYALGVVVGAPVIAVLAAKVSRRTCIADRADGRLRGIANSLASALAPVLHLAEPGFALR
jgi:DHA1 family inner membrane transport protein